jgi:hypothetical protein
MAYVQDPNDPNATPQAGTPGAASPMNQPPQTSTGAGGATAGPAGTPQGVSATPATTQAPPVQDLKAYLAANAPQAVGMGQQIAGGLNQEYQTATGDIQSAQTAQDQAIKAGSVSPNQDLVSAAAANPSEFVQTPQNIQDFLAQENAAYTGPSSDTTTAAINSVNIPTPPDINKPGGVRQLVTGLETNPTIGMENLDTLLLQENPEAMAPIQAALPQFLNLAPQQTSAAAAETAAIQKAIADAEAAKSGVQTTFNGPGGVVPTFQARVNQELNTDIGQANTYNEGLDKLITELNGANVPIQDIKKAVEAYNYALTSKINTTPPGILQTMFQKTSPLNMEPLPQIPNKIGVPTINQVVTPEDISNQKALETLLGNNYTPFFNPEGQTQYQSPGNAPIAKNELDSILSSLQGQPLNPYVTFNGNLGSHPAGWIPPNDPELIAAENELQQYLSSLT